MRRNRSLEWLRVVAAFGIVWFHSGAAGGLTGYTGLTVFLILSLLFETGPNHGRIVPVRTRAVRLLVPWSFWWVVFGALNLVRHRPPIQTGHGPIAGILAGPSIHLWYLPYLFTVLVIVGAAKRYLSAIVLAVVAFSVAAGLIATMSAWRAWIEPYAPAAQWLHAIVPACIGILFGCGSRDRRLAALPAMVGLMLVASLFDASPAVGGIYLAGTLLVAAAVMAPAAWVARLPDATPLSGAMFGVYLVHPLALTLVRPITDRAWPVGVTLAFLLSTAAVLLARRTMPRLARRIL